ncbi:MAG: hypothetical protein ABL994_08155 [Verrucomicrobiales bacterium]
MRLTSGQSPDNGRSKIRGAALVAILWVIAILSIAVFSATQFLFVGVESESNADASFRAETLAERGIALAAHPQMERGDPVLVQILNERESFEARISSEGARLNLNTLLANHERDRIVLEELFYQWGMRRDEAVDLVDNLVDWVDEDDLPTSIGAERGYYLSVDRPNHPFNRAFVYLEEALLVKDFATLTRLNPDWMDSFTLLSQGPLDLNEAPPELVSVACQCSFEAARLFVQTRNGLDGLDGTEDDLRFRETEEAMALLGLPGDGSDAVLGRVSISDSVQRLISVGRYGTVSVESSVTLTAKNESGKILQWGTHRIE